MSHFEFEALHSLTSTLESASTLSNKTVVSLQIELIRKRTEWQINHELMADYIKACKQAQIEEARALVRLKRDEAVLETEEQLLT